MIKKVVISAAGRGTRMLDFAKYRPKHLIKVNGIPFLCYLLSNLAKAGLKEMIMVIGYKKELMEEFVHKHKREFDITVVNQFEKVGNKYGTACPIECVENIINENFISVNGDNLYAPEDLRRMMIDDEFIYVAGLKYEEPKKYGVLVPDGDEYLEKIIEKPKEPVSGLVNIGLYKFTPEIFRAVKQVTLSPRGEYELTDAISLLAGKKKVKIKTVDGYWLDFGKPEDIKTIEGFLEKGKL